MILLNFNNRNDNFGDQLISYLLYTELQKSGPVFYISTKPEIVAPPPLRLRKALALIAFTRLKGKKVLLIDPPCARVHVENLPKPDFKKKLVEFILNSLITERHVLSISIDARVDPYQFNIYKSIGVRDNSSLTFINKYHAKAFFTPDMACLLPIKKPSFKGRKTIVSFRENTPDNNYSSDYSLEIVKKLPLILDLLETESEVYFYSQVEEDDEFNLKLSSKIINKPIIQIINKQQKENYYQELFNDCQYVISNRLHVILPAMINGILTIPLLSRSHKKIIDLLTSYGLDKTIVYIDSKKDIENSIFNILANKDDILFAQYEKLQQLNFELKTYISQFAT